MTLGPPAAAEQLQNAIAMGIESAVLLETERSDWDPQATAAALADALRDGGHDLLLFGNESADSGGYQVGIRVAHALGLPCVTGIKGIEIADGMATRRGARRAAAGRSSRCRCRPWSRVKEGINLPRYASLPGRLRAKKTEIVRVEPAWREGGLRKQRLRRPAGAGLARRAARRRPGAPRRASSKC